MWRTATHAGRHGLEYASPHGFIARTSGNFPSAAAHALGERSGQQLECSTVVFAVEFGGRPGPSGWVIRTRAWSGLAETTLKNDSRLAGQRWLPACRALLEPDPESAARARFQLHGTIGLPGLDQ